MSYYHWVLEVADALNIEPEEVANDYREVPRQLYDKGCSPNEAADFLRLYC